MHAIKFAFPGREEQQGSLVELIWRGSEQKQHLAAGLAS